MRVESQRWGWIFALAAVVACTEDPISGPSPPPGLVGEIRQLASQFGITPLAPPLGARPALVTLGQALVFDKILSGNHDVSCMTCHLPSQATSDGLSLSIGQGAFGLGPGRTHPEGAFIPRNSLPMFNLTALRTHFWDGRLAAEEAGGLTTPAGPDVTPDMLAVFEFGPISALGLFPVLSREEMRAFVGNELAAIDDEEPRGVWVALMARLGAIPEYRTLFEAAYPGTPFDEMTFGHASNAMAAFFAVELSFIDTPWDRFLAGDDDALTREQLEGARDFITIGRCINCHTGPLLTDELFHSTGLAQFGPGHGNGAGGTDDFGRSNVTGSLVHRYQFRTPPLRNVELTAPYGHAGQFRQLRDFVDHYSDVAEKLRSYDPTQLDPLLQASIVENREEVLATLDPLVTGAVFGPDVTNRITEFLTALTDDRARALDRIVPPSVPSGLPIDR